jgi:hypothetical protein
VNRRPPGDFKTSDTAWNRPTQLGHADSEEVRKAHAACYPVEPATLRPKIQIHSIL